PSVRGRMMRHAKRRRVCGLAKRVPTSCSVQHCGTQTQELGMGNQVESGAARLVLCQRRTDQLFVVAKVNTAVGKRRVRPDYRPAGVFVGWLDEVCPAEFLIARGRQVGDDQIAVLVGEEESISVRDDEGVGPPHRARIAAGGGERLPNLLTRLGLETAELAVGA